MHLILGEQFALIYKAEDTSAEMRNVAKELLQMIAQQQQQQKKKARRK